MIRPGLLRADNRANKRQFEGRSLSDFATLGLMGLGLAIGSITGAVAQEGQRAGVEQPPQSSWVKVCETEQNSSREICVVNQELRNQQGNFVVSVGVREFQDNKEKALVVGLPLGMALQPGIRYQIDDGEQQPGQYTICIPTGCFAEVPIDDAVVTAMKRGNELILLAISGRGQTVPFRLSLVGFTATFDGPPIDPEVLRQTQERLQQEIQRRAEEARRRLLEQQGQSGGEAPATNQ